MILLEGVAASPGIAIGKSLLKKEEKIKIDKKNISNDQIENEIQKLHKALNKSKKSLKKLKEETAENLGEEQAEIFTAHLMILDDPEVIPLFEDKIKNNKINAEAAVKAVIDEFSAVFTAMEDQYLKERGSDIKDVGMRIIKNLLGIKNLSDKLKKDIIIIADDLTPSDTAKLDTDKVLAFVTKKGSKTSHSAIMARSLGIPAVVGVGNKLIEKSENNMEIIVDGNKAKIFLNPDQATLNEYKDKLKKYEAEQQSLDFFKDKKAETKDGYAIEVVGNMGNIEDVNSILANGGEGVGLFRSEFLYMDRSQLPSEEEQFNVYKKVAKKMGDRPVIIRTLDVGGDKELSYLDFPEEMNPFLGYRAIRVCLQRDDIFKPQLKALLRASSFGNLKIMFPMISSLEELQAAKAKVKEVKSELKADGVKYNKDIDLGIMIEIPAAVMIAERLAKEVDFFSIGTNDLIQYTVAVDRMNKQISAMHTPYHPAVLRLIKKTIEAAHAENIWVGMCGEAAGEELLIPFLLGVGLDEFSMSAVSILKTKETLSKWTLAEAKKESEKLMEFSTAAEVKRYLNNLKK